MHSNSSFLKYPGLLVEKNGLRVVENSQKRVSGSGKPGLETLEPVFVLGYNFYSVLVVRSASWLKLKVLIFGNVAKKLYLWPFAKKLYHGWISMVTLSNEIAWKLSPPPKWRAGCAPASSDPYETEIE